MAADRAIRPPAVAVFGIALTAVVAASAGIFQHIDNKNTAHERFSALTREFTTLVEERFQLYQYGLRGTRGAIIAGGRINIPRNTFEEYFSSRERFQEFPGARGFGFIVKISNEQTARFIEAARVDEFPSFNLRELAPNAGERFIIKYIYPLKGNEGATGLDIASESNRRTAALNAARSGETRLTAPITLVQASGETNHGFLILMPIYWRADVPDDPEERVKQTVGWSYSPLVVSEVLKDLGPRREEIAFSITDVSDEIEFYRSPGFDPRIEAVIGDEVEVFGRRWRLSFHPRPAFAKQYAGITPGILSLTLVLLGILGTATAYNFSRNRAQAQQARWEEEELAYKIIDATPQALLVVNQAGIIIRANAYCERVFGWSMSDLLGKPVDDLVPPNVRDAHKELRENYDYQPRNMGSGQDLEAVRADGTRFPITARLAPLSIGDRKLVVAGVTDISAEREAVKVMAASEQRWQEVANSLPQLVWTCDANGVCDFLSQQWADYTGASSRPLLGDGWLDWVHPDDQEHLMAVWRKSVETKVPFSTEFRIRGHDGTYRLFFARADPVMDADGNVLRWLGSNTDIEDRHQAELQVRALLREMEDRVATRTVELNTALRDLRNVLDSVPSMIAYWDSDQHNRFANKAYEEWFGVTPEWLAGRHIKELMGEDLYQKSLVYIEGALRGEPQAFERELVDAEGVPRFTQAQYLPDVSGEKVQGFYVFVFDVTAIKASEIAQKQAREAAEAATRAKSAFLTSMSHELRTPMNSILGFTDILISQHFGTLNDKQLEHASLIKRSGQHLLSLMDSVLELSKIEAGRITISIEPVNVVAIVKSVMATLEPLAEKFGVEMRAPNLGRDDSFVTADVTRLTQVMINLGSNAIKYNRAGGWVEFSCEALSRETFRITVTDNGRGIPADRQSGVFQPFNRLGAEQGKIEGSGIGLALVRNYVELMGGRIDFESVEGEGSRFWVDLHSADVENVNNHQESADADAPKTQRIAGHMKVLYVEDNDINRALFENFMEMLDDVEYLEAEDGATGLAIARDVHPDVIFLDIDLPDMNGYDVLAEIRSDPELRYTPVIALTANAMSGDAERGLDAGFDRYLPKPFKLEEILTAVTEQRDVIERRKRPRTKN
ncbi:PAS domain S-box protein [Thalassospiraceae bacterium LMO-SO8]|nr:PAS domain S-box protein [Alphaproteobacteria bacterium LMO-S08]WND76159.1 PAS domain S-box protein [Thalassospiraceae bacterium LMO-SO8]